MNTPDGFDSECVVRTRSSGGLSGVTFHADTRTRLSLSYFSLHSASLLESGEVVLVFTGYEITLRGSGLEQLPEDFILHKILRVKKSSSRCDLFDSANAESIEAIQITKSE